MKLIWPSSVVLTFGIVLISCFAPPAFSPNPSIEFNTIKFKDVGDASDSDSLIFTINFKDGDGNLGLDPSEVDPPYNNKFYYQFPDGSYITYETKRTNPDYDTLPEFVNPYNCTNWEVIRDNLGRATDTLYFQLNQNYYNIFVKFFVSTANGDFVEFDWRKEFSYPKCGLSFDGRFPILSKDLGHKSPLEGQIRYAMGSVGFKLLFSIKTMYLQIQIQDRALNKSNVVNTPKFTLQSIQ